MNKRFRDTITFIGLVLTLTPLVILGLIALWNGTLSIHLSVIAGLLVLTAIVSVGVLLWVSELVTQPLLQLVTWVNQINTGDPIDILSNSSITELSALTTALKSMQMRVEESVDELEERSQLRTRAMETVADISHLMTQQTELDDLLNSVATRIQHEFEFYHTHIYLLDKQTGEMVLSYVSVEANCPLLREEPTPSADSSVGQVISTRKLLLNNNLADALDFSAHPLMPDTRAELVLPLQKGDTLLGVLDLHSHTAHRFTDEDVALFQIIADQLSLSIAHHQESERANVATLEIDRLHKRLTRTNWAEAIRDDNAVIGYEFKAGHLSPITEPRLPSNAEHLSVPLMLRGEQIGQLRVARRVTAEAWRDEEVTAVNTVANQVTLALENARLSTEQEKTIFKLQELDRLKSEFLTSMSHELRTPLNAILGFADILLQGIDGDLTDYARNDIQLIYNSGQHLLTIINDILDISKIEAGMMEIVPMEIDVHPFLGELYSASETLIQTKPVTLQTDLPETLPPIYADRIRLKQILLNLIGNAVKFTDEGTVTIQAKLHPVEDGMMRFAVIDTGIGIPEDKQEAIFERFKQADMTNTREYGGTGLGLTICKELIQMHGGQLGVKSQAGHGSEFYFTIPLAEPVANE